MNQHEFEIDNLIKQAKDENTSPNRLKQIYQDHYLCHEIQIALVNNPNTPLEILFELGEEFSFSIISKSCLRFIFLE